VRTPLAAVVVALAAVLVAAPPATPGPPLSLPPTAQLPQSATSHAVMIVMENKSRYEVMSNSGSKYVRELAKRYAVPSKMFAIRHPSLPNYLALLGGGTFGVTDDCTSCSVDGRTLVDQLEEAGFSWKGYMEGMPSRCYGGAGSGGYAKKHNPFAYFRGIRDDSSSCARVVPYKRLGRDLVDGALPDFAFIAPDLCNDTHDCPIATGDRFLAHLVPALLRELGPHGILFVTWDEGRTDRGCCGLARGGRIVTVVAGPDVRRGAKGPGKYSHYSTLRTIDEAFGLPPLGHAGSSRTKSFGALFTRSHRGALMKPGR
jgi:phosphatidylinositol-3-phosphatase